jgi:very-short-patch-repair endonuclease
MHNNHHYNKTLKPFARQLRSVSTLAEVLLWRRIKSRQIKGYQFLRQRPILDFIVDFYCKELMLAIEIDGPSHYENESADALRDYRLAEIGVRVLRFSDRTVKKSMISVIYAIEEWILLNHKKK